MYMKNLKLLIGAMLLACACNCTGGEKKKKRFLRCRKLWLFRRKKGP